MSRERLGSRLGFILLSAGCAIGCGNVWKFPAMCGENGGAGFVLIYLVCLLVLGLPVMTMEFAIGRAAQKSPVKMYQELEKPKDKWHLHGYASMAANVALMSFYTVVTGWFIYYFYRFAAGDLEGLKYVENVCDPYENMTGNPGINVLFLAITVVLTFAVLCFNIQGGLERVTKVMMILLLALIIGLAVYSCTLSKAAEGLKFYLIPDFSEINGQTIVDAMNQSFFTLSVGIGAMAIFGSYIDKKRSLMGESANIILLDTFVALMAGLIIFPACFTYYGGNVKAGPGLLFNTMSTVFCSMKGGRVVGTLFFLFMTFAGLSTTLAVCENILAMFRELTGWSRPKGCLVCGTGIFLLSLTTALGFSVLSGFVPFADGTSFFDLWDFIVNTNMLPLGSLVIVLFCCNKFGWGWDNFVTEANAGQGMKVRTWMKPIFRFVVPVVIAAIYIYGLVTFPWH